VRRFGRHGATLAARARGVDPDPVGQGEAAKSIGHEHTFDVDTSDAEVIERTLLAMAEGVAGRLRATGVKAGTVTVKIRDASFRTVTRQRTLPEPTDLPEPIWRTALDLARPEVRGIRVRLLGVTASGLGERDQMSLFSTEDPRRRKAIEAADALRRRYGERAVTRARLIGTNLPAPFERDHGTPTERRGIHAADARRGQRRTGAAADRQGDTDAPEDPLAEG
jgi:DNA polymerase IV